MSKHIFPFLFALLFLQTGFSQDLEAYRFYNHKGKKVTFHKMAKRLTAYDVVLFGEHHDNALNHWLQRKLTEALYELKDGRLTLGAEMFERDNQAGLDLYVNGKIDEKQLTDTVRLWNNFKTDYLPLVNFAKEHQLTFVATNVPRRYASVVARHGQDSLRSLPEREKTYMAPLPIEVDMETPGYPEMAAMLQGHAHGMQPENFVAAQAIKDATMAASILANLSEETLFIHYNGDYHSKAYGGIYWHLKRQQPELKVAVISIFESPDTPLSLPEEAVLTQFNLVLPEDGAKSY